MNIRIAAFGLIALLFIPLTGHADKEDRSDNPGDRKPLASGKGSLSTSNMATIYLFRPSRFISRWATPTVHIVAPNFRCSVYLKNKTYVRFQAPASQHGYQISAPYSANWQLRGGDFTTGSSKAGETYYIGLLPFGTGYRMTPMSASEAKKYLKKLKPAKKTTCK